MFKFRKLDMNILSGDKGLGFIYRDVGSRIRMVRKILKLWK